MTWRGNGMDQMKSIKLLVNMLEEVIQRLEQIDKRLDVIESLTEKKTFEYEFNDFMTFMFSDLGEGDDDDSIFN